MKSKFINIRCTYNNILPIHYLDNSEKLEQSKNTLVFIHGLGANASVWLPSIKALMKKNPSLRCLALDLPNHGKSGSLKHLSLDVFIDSIYNFIKHLGFAKIILVGHSLGACLLMHSYNNPLHTRKVKQYFLISPIGIQPMKESQKKMIKNIYDVKFLMKIGKYGSYKSFKRYFVKYNTELDNIWKNIEIDIENNPSQYYKTINALVNCVIEDYQLNTTNIFEKVHFIIGNQDVLVPFKLNGEAPTLEEIQKQCTPFFPNSKWTFLNHCGHYPQLEQKNDVVNLIMRDL